MLRHLDSLAWCLEAVNREPPVVDEARPAKRMGSRGKVKWLFLGDVSGGRAPYRRSGAGPTPPAATTATGPHTVNRRCHCDPVPPGCDVQHRLLEVGARPHSRRRDPAGTARCRRPSTGRRRVESNRTIKSEHRPSLGRLGPTEKLPGDAASGQRRRDISDMCHLRGPRHRLSRAASVPRRPPVRAKAVGLPWPC